MIEGGPSRIEVVTDPAGEYRVGGLPPGNFKVKLLLSERLYAFPPSPEVTTHDKGCTRLDFSVVRNGRIEGYIRKPAGGPASRVRIEVFRSPRPAGERPEGVRWTESAPDGRFEFQGLDPGQYYLGTGTVDVTQPKQPYVTLFFPGVLDHSAARSFQVGEGERITGVDWTLPPLPEERQVRGIVVWPDGHPAAGAKVFYGTGSLVGQTGLIADSQGAFSMEAYDGVPYTIYAKHVGEDGRPAMSAFVKIPARGEAGDIRLVLGR